MSNTKVTERDTKATILAAYEELKAENERLQQALTLAKTPPRTALKPGVLRLRAVVGDEASPFWEKLKIATDTPSAKGEPSRKLQLAKECFGGATREAAMKFMAAIASVMEREGHLPVFKGSYLRVVFRSAPQPPSDSHPDVPEFGESSETI